MREFVHSFVNSSKGKINIPLMYFHRYLRLTPLLGITVLLSMSLLRFLGNGPIWPILFESYGESCKRNWWTVLLYVQNYLNPTDIVSFDRKKLIQQRKNYYWFYFLIFCKVFSTFLVFVRWHATFCDIASHHLFTLQI